MASELYQTLDGHPDVELHTVVQRSAWRWIVPRTFLFEFSLPLRLPKIVERESIDVVLFTSMTTAIPTVVTGKRLQIKGARLAAIALGMDVTTPFPVHQAFVRKMFRTLDAVFPISHATGEECIERGLPKSRMRVIPCGIDLSYVESLEKRTQRTRHSGSAVPKPPSDDTFLLLSVGRHVRRKGFGWFAEHVLPSLPEDVHYWIAGQGPESPAIERAVERAGVGNRVRMLGTVREEELHHLYHDADLFVMPNIRVPGDMEGFGVVMLEAGLRGLPTVAANLEGIRDVISEGENGYLCPHGDSEAFRKKILTLKNDGRAHEQLGHRAASFVRNNFSWEVVADELVDAMMQMCDRTRTKAQVATH